MASIDISIVIVNYNVKDFLYKCLSSIKAASQGLSIETIVVDNNSVDGSMEYLIPLFPEVNFIKLSDNIGFGRANNFAFEIAKGEFILILNPDTILEEQTLHKMIEFMESDASCGIAGCKVLNADGTFQMACRRGFPTPWAAFSKLFGLQKVFPKSKLFAKYNQTYLPTDETYYIDAVIGAFMFCRSELIRDLKGFDPDFFMYGEDIDLCFRAKKMGWNVAYVHTTSIVHYKGESTKRSSINEVKHFYNAMEIFVKKHYSKSFIFLLFLKTGIYLRQSLAYFEKFHKELLIILTDIAIVNSSLLIATKIWRDDFLDFPEYAYPDVFIVLSFTLIISMVFSGEYLEKKHSIRKMFSGYLLMFFIISSLTYFFKDFAFSRGVVLLTTGIAITLSSIMRISNVIYQKSFGKYSERRVAIVGNDEQTKKLINSINNQASTNIHLVGIVSVDNYSSDIFENQPVIGAFEFLPKLIKFNNINEVIIADKRLKYNTLLTIISKSSDTNARFHFASEYDDFIASGIFDDITGEIPEEKNYNFFTLKNRMIKRSFDIFSSFILITIGLPFIYFMTKDFKKYLSRLLEVMSGKKSLVGLYVKSRIVSQVGKEGLISLAEISNPERLTIQALNSLNDYYLKNYSFSLDLDIIIKYLFRKKRGK